MHRRPRRITRLIDGRHQVANLQKHIVVRATFRTPFSLVPISSLGLIPDVLRAYGYYMKKTNAKALSLLFLALPCLALNGQCNVNPLCGGDSVAAVVLNITDAQGQTIPSATTSFRLNGGGPYIGSCLGNCNQVTLAFEITGRFDISVSTPGYVTANRTVNVLADEGGCHPVTKQIIVVLERDLTVGALNGAWTTNGWYGLTTLRFGESGEIIGAILYDRTIADDGNFYYAYNGRQIRGAPGQQIWTDDATDPTRSGNIFNFRDNPVSIPIGFENAAISTDYNTLTGTLQGTAATYTRLDEIPAALQDP